MDGLYLNHTRHLKMIEPFVPVFIAVGTGFAVLTSRIYSKISYLDRRVDGVELRIVQDFVSKTELQIAMDRMEGHLIRMEDKLRCDCKEQVLLISLHKTQRDAG